MPALCFKIAGVSGSTWNRVCENAIGWWTRKDLPAGAPHRFCHVELLLDGECFSSTLETGTRYGPVDVSDPKVWVHVDIPASPDEVAHAVAWAKAHCGEKYNRVAIVGFVTARFPIPFCLSSHHEMFCSQSDCRCCRANFHAAKDWPDPTLKASKISPNKLYAIAKGVA